MSSGSDFFNKEASQSYDDKNIRLAPVSENLHFLIRLVLKDLPTRSKILCVGVGTGAEILFLAKIFPAWTFVGLDPSASMLDICRNNLRKSGVLDRCQLVHGFSQDLPAGEGFDAALSILVAHFVKREERFDFFQNMVSRLKTGGFLINAEIGFDLSSLEFPEMVKQWAKIQELMGATPESLAKLPVVLREVLSVLPPCETEEILRQTGLDLPIRFFQAFMICGWYARKKGKIFS